MAESVSTSEQPPEEHDPLVGTVLNDGHPHNFAQS